MKKLKRSLCVFITVIMLFTSTSTVFAEEDKAKELKATLDVFYLNGIQQIILEDYYKDDVTEKQLYGGALKAILEEHPELLPEAINGMFEILDKHSMYFTQDEYKTFSNAIDRQFGGIGVVITEQDYITVVEVMKDMPGEKAGIKVGDKILSIDDIDVTKYNIHEAGDLMRGEIGDSIKLGIKRKNVKDIIYIDVVRDVIKVSPVYYESANDKVGYLEIIEFSKGVSEDVKEAIDYFQSKNIKNVIVDLRDNPGGRLDEVVEIAKYFVPKGKPIVHVDYRKGSKVTYCSDSRPKMNMAIVLVNEKSASAAEILAGAIQDNKTGVIIGKKSYGKGTVQELLELRRKDAMKLTVAQYLTPKRVCIDGEGIHPDLKVENIIKKIDINELEKVNDDSKLSKGDKGKEVLGIKQRLNLLGYNVGDINEVFDESTEKTVKLFQKHHNLDSCGVVDSTIIKILNDEVTELEIEVDVQLQKALEFIK